MYPASTTPPSSTRSISFPSPVKLRRCERMVPLDSASVLRYTKGGLIEEAGRVLRLLKVHHALPDEGVRKATALQNIKGLFDSQLRILGSSSLDTADKDKILKSFQEEAKNRMITLALRPYTDLIRNASDQKGIKKCLEGFKKEIRFFSGSAPVRKSLHGDRGPTLLVTYFNDDKLNEYVIKFANTNEWVATKVLDAVSWCFEDNKSYSLNFSVAPMTKLEFVRDNNEGNNSLNFSVTPMSDSGDKSIETTGETSEPRNEDIHELIKTLIEIPKRLSPDNNNTQPTFDGRLVVLLSYLIPGMNLPEFACTNYSNLDLDHKKKFFERLARLSIIDFVLANTDRFWEIKTNSEGAYYLVKDMARANLGNVMVTYIENDPRIYPIDNSIDQVVLDGKDAKKAYKKFLVETLSSDFKLLASILAETISQSLIRETDEIYLPESPKEEEKNSIDEPQKTSSYDRRKIVQAHEQMRNDLLNSEIIEAIEKGMRTTAQWLKDHVAKEWETNEKYNSIKDFLSKYDQKYRDTIEQNILTFKDKPNTSRA